MNRMSVVICKLLLGLAFLAGCLSSVNAWAAAQSTYTPTMGDYCIKPPFLSDYVPPQVLFTLGKDHKFYYPAYNDASDIDNDGQLETTYKHAFDYYGYFDSNKCYSYASGVFTPFGITSDKYCAATNCTNNAGSSINCSGKFSGNFLNWATMSRADIVKMVIYGGFRTSDNNGTNYAQISGEFIPQDGHIWGKEYLGADAPKLFPGGVADKRALLCVNGTSSGSNNISQLKIIPDVTAVGSVTVSGGLRAWHWINVDGNADICSDNKIDLSGNGVSQAATLTGRANYEVTVKVCDPASGYNYLGDWEKKHCKNYSNSTPQDPNGPWRPVGLMQIYGETPNSAKVCSMDMSTACTNDSNCTGNGQCVNASNMFFGLIAGSFNNPQAGGFIRKDIYSINEETNQSNGILQTSASSGKGLLMKSIEEMKCPTTYPLSTHLGNPMGEIMYEGLRYWSGRGTPTAAFVNGISQGTKGDNNNYASKPTWDAPATLYPSCSIPFNLVFSDVYNSYDHDQVPGSAFASVTGDLVGFNAKDLADKIWANENLGTSIVTGESGTTVGDNVDGRCNAKTISGLGSVKGLCPSEGGQSGTYYPASAALYGSTMMKSNMKTPNVFTYVVAFNSNVPQIKVVTNSGKSVLIEPYGKSVSNSFGWNCTTTNTDFNVANVTTSGGTTTKNLTFKPKLSTSSCPQLAQVSFYILEQEYDASNNLKYIKFRTATDDLGGGDFDLDMLTEYTVCAQGAGNPACAGLTGNQVSVKTERAYSSAGNPAALGFTITGAGSDSGTYLVVQHTSGPPAGSGWAASPLVNTNASMTFVAAGSAVVPKPPLWYAAKYGGFKDSDNDGLPYTDSTCSEALTSPTRNPKCNEWSSKIPGVPDTYFEVSNPSQMESRLRDALESILSRVSSGTAASILNNSEGSGASLLQAVFYPQKDFDDSTKGYWTGELHNMWYYIDPNLKQTSIREDTTGDYKLNITNDMIAQFYFDTSESKTKVNLYKDANGDGSPDSTTPYSTVEPDKVKSLWKAGKMLWERNLSSNPRTIYTHTDLYDNSANGLSLFSDAAYSGLSATNKTSMKSYLQVADDTSASNVIKYVHGYDSKEINSTTPPNFRNRTVSITDCTISSADGGCKRTWKLGDIISSTPKLVSSVQLNSFGLTSPNGYGDKSYNKFIATSTYKNRGMVFVGGNDGMLHAFKLGVLKPLDGAVVKAQFNNSSGVLATSADMLGQEEWSFIPKQTLPYLTYLTDQNYCHLYYVDKTSTLVDVNINKPTTCTSTNYWDCVKPMDGSNWSTLLIGGTGFGGASKWNGNNTYTAPTDSVKTPVKGTAAADGLGYSSYYALDVTDPTTPKYKWEFPGVTSALQQMGYSTTGAAIIRISAKIKDGGGNDTVNPDHNKNGRWFAVFASGPTGPIDTSKREFKAQSDQQLRIFVVDLATGALVRTIDKYSDNSSLPAEAFGGSLATSWVDTDRATPANAGWYSDDAIYIGYTRKCTGTDIGCTSGTWTKGGVIRLLTKENIDPANWTTSSLISNIGPVTSSVTKLQDRQNKKLWIYFGTGRFYFKNDDTASQQVLYGVKEPCYTTANLMDGACTTAVSSAGLVNQSGNAFAGPAATLAANASGWYINLDASTTAFGSERVITDPLAAPSGAVFFTTFRPSNDICKFGGDTFIWALRYDTGGVPSASAMKGKALMQVSTGAFAEITLSDAFKSTTNNKREDGRKLSQPISGVPPTAQGLSLVTNPPPVKRMLHVREK